MKKLQILKEKKTFFLIVFYIALDILSRMPYLNIYLRPWITLSLLWIYIVVFYKVKFRYTFGIIFLALSTSALAIIWGRQGIADEAGNFIYLLLLIGTVQFFFETYKNLRK